MNGRSRAIAFAATLSLSLLAAAAPPAVADIQVALEVRPATPDEEFPDFLLAGQSLVFVATLTQDSRPVRERQTAVYGKVLPGTPLAFHETSAGRFASTPVAFASIGSFTARVEAHLVDLPPGAAPRVVENLRKIRAQIAAFEAKIAYLQSQPGNHGEAIAALEAATENRREALRNLLKTQGGFAETSLDFAVHPVPIVVSGNNQTGTVGSPLPDPLVLGMAKVDRTTRIRTEGITYRWSASAGSLDAETTLTATSGETSNRLRLPSTPGRVTIGARDEVGGVTGPGVTFTATVEDFPLDPQPTEPALELQIVGDGRSAHHQFCISERGEGLLPMIVRVQDPYSPGRPVPLVPVAFEVVEGTGLFIYTDGLSICSNLSGEAGIYFIPTSEGRNVVRARVFREASADSSPVLFTFDADVPRIELAGTAPKPGLVGNALDRPFRVQVTGLDGQPIHREVVRFRLGKDVPPSAGSFVPETSRTDTSGYAESVFVIAQDAIPADAPEPRVVPIEIVVPGFGKLDGSPVKVETSVTIETYAQRASRGEVVFEEVVSGNGVVGHKNFFTKVPFVVRSLAGFVSDRMTFVVIQGGGRLRAAFGQPLNIDLELIRRRFPDRNVTDALTLELNASREAGVFYEAADDESPGVIAAYVELTAGGHTVYGAVSPPDVRIVSLDGNPLGGVGPADPDDIDPERDAFLLEARLPVGFDPPIVGKLATLTRLGEIATGFPEAAAPVSIDDIELAEITSDTLGAMWRSSLDRPFVAIRETFDASDERPRFSEGIRPIQVPDHGWLLPRAILAGAPANDEGDRNVVMYPMVKHMYFYDGLDFGTTTPPASEGEPEAATPILAKTAIRWSGTDPSPVVYSVEANRVDADFYDWSIESPDGQVIELKQTREPRIHLWIHDDPDDTTRDTDPFTVDEDGPLSPAIVGIANSPENLRAVRTIRVTAVLGSSGTFPNVVGTGTALRLPIATRTSWGVGTSNIGFADGDLRSHLPLTFPGAANFMDPPHGEELDTDEEVMKQIAKAGGPSTREGFRLSDWMTALQELGLTITQYWDPGTPHFDSEHRLLWLGRPEDRRIAQVFGEAWSPSEVENMLLDEEIPALRFRALHSYGVALSELEKQAMDDADICNLVILHESWHVLERAQLHELAFPEVNTPDDAVVDSQFHAVLSGRAIESFRACYQEKKLLERDALRRARLDYTAFLRNHKEVGAYAREMRWFNPSMVEFLGHPCRTNQTYAQRDEVLGSHAFYDFTSRNFVHEYGGALLYSFVRLPHVLRKDGRVEIVDPLCAIGDTQGEIRDRIFDYFDAVFTAVYLQMPSLYGGSTAINSSKFVSVIKNTGRDANNPWVIYRPYELK